MIGDPTHEDDWEGHATGGKLTPELDSGHAAKMDIDDKTRRGTRRHAVEHGFPRRPKLGIVPGAAQQPANRSAHRRIIVHNRDNFSHQPSTCYVGSKSIPPARSRSEERRVGK